MDNYYISFNYYLNDYIIIIRNLLLQTSGDNRQTFSKTAVILIASNVATNKVVYSNFIT